MVAGLMSAAMAWAASGINYDGTSLELNNEFTRTECGTQKKSVMKEISGMACSRQTTGYLWAHSDENLDSNRKIIAIKPDGTLAMTVKLTTSSGRDDWEDIWNGERCKAIRANSAKMDGSCPLRKRAKTEREDA